MSGHSKWHSIRHKKGAADAKRGKVFSKLSKQITVCAREGGSDLAMNFGLRLAVEKAKAANMPKDNIERAIQKGAGGGAGEDALKTAIYEGMGPGGSALIVEALTDNPNRTIATSKTAFNKKGGNIDAKVMWLFSRKGVVLIEDTSLIKDRDAFELAVIDAGAEEVEEQDGQMQIICEVEYLQKILDVLDSLEVPVGEAGIKYLANDLLEIGAEDQEKLDELIEVLEDDEEISASSYLEFIVEQLRACGGVIETEQLSSDVFAAFSREMTSADLRTMENRNVPKWKNSLDWAKAIGAKKNILSTIKQGKHKFVVLLDPTVTEKEWLELAEEQKGRRKASFKKRCPKCRCYQPLRSKYCKLCGAEMPVSEKRRVSVTQ